MTDEEIAVSEEQYRKQLLLKFATKGENYVPKYDTGTPIQKAKIDSYLRALDSGKLDNYYKNKEIRRKYVEKSRQKTKQKNKQNIKKK